MRQQLLLTFIALLLIIPTGPVRAQADMMVKHVPVESNVEREKRSFTFDSGTVTLAEAERVAGHFHNKYGDDENVSVYKIPGSGDFYLVSGAMGHQEETDFGLRFFLVKKEGDDYKQLFRGRGAGDSYNLDPYFYTNADRVLIISESGTEYSWGLSAYEFRNGKLKTLGTIDVARWSGENYIDPRDRATVFLRNGQYVVEFASNLRLDPGGLHPWWLVRAKDKISFVQDGNRFILTGDSVGIQVCFYFPGEPVTDDDNEVLSDLDYYYGQLMPWWEKNGISHSFQMDLPLRMIPSDGKEVLISREELPGSVGIVLMDRKGEKKFLEGVRTGVDLILEMRAWSGMSLDK
jgi:hypothetical protein